MINADKKLYELHQAHTTKLFYLHQAADENGVDTVKNHKTEEAFLASAIAQFDSFEQAVDFLLSQMEGKFILADYEHDAYIHIEYGDACQVEPFYKPEPFSEYIPEQEEHEAQIIEQKYRMGARDAEQEYYPDDMGCDYEYFDNRRDECSACRGGGCPHCEPHRFIDDFHY